MANPTADAQSLTPIALIVRDYDEAIAWFTDKLGFTLVADERVGPEQAAVSPGHGCEHPGDVHTSSGPPRQPEQDKRREQITSRLVNP